MNFEDKRVLIYDTGWYVELAPVLARSFGEVYYFSPWQQSEFPYSADAAVGQGLEGVTRVSNFWDYVEFSDLIVFPGQNDPDLQNYLRKSGKLVWGSGDAEELELNRVLLKKFLEAHNLPFIPYLTITGVDALRSYLEKSEDKYVKLAQGFRGDTETWHHETWEKTVAWWLDMAARLGPVGNTTRFLVEPGLPGFEGGFDSYSVDGKTPSILMIGYEIKDSCYVSTLKRLDDLPPSLRDVHDALQSYFASQQFRNFFSSEIRITDQNEGYLIDLAARFPSPPYGTEIENLANLDDIMYYGAQGILIEPKYRYKYGVELNLTSPWLAQHWLPLEIEDRDRRFVKIHNVMRYGETYWTRSQERENNAELGAVGSVVALSNDFDAAVKECVERAERVKGIRLELDPSDIEKATKTIKEGEAHGLKWS